MVHVRSYQFILHRPFEASANPADRFVDVTATPTFIDHPLTDCFECQGAKFVGDLAPVQLPDDFQRFEDATVFARDPTVLAIIVFRKLPIGIEHFDHGGIGVVLQSATVG